MGDEKGALRWLREGSLRPVLLLTAGAVLFGLLAGREANRARATSALLMKDYASFIAEKLVRASASHPGFGLSEEVEERNPETVSPRSALLRFVRERERDPEARLPEPRWPGARYFFSYEASDGSLDFEGERLDEAEREQLASLLASYRPSCGSGLVIPFAQLRHLSRDAAKGEEEWQGWLQTDAGGGVLRIAGVRFDETALVESFLRPLIENEECECPTLLLPESLMAVGSNRKSASFVIRDGRGRTRYRSEPVYENGSRTERALSAELPLPGWTVSVTVNPEVVKPLLPYGGNDVPWLLLGFLLVLVVGSGALVVRSLGRSAALLRAQQDFVGNVSHELKTPLARIRLFNELLSTGKQSSSTKRARYREVIDRECRRLGFLVDNVLDFSRQRRGTHRYDFERLNLREVVDEALDAFRSASDAGRFRLEERLADVPEVLGDRSALQRVLVNLLDNAVKYQTEPGRVEVGLSTFNGSVELSVRDEGPGIPESKREQIFEAFYRLESGESQPVAGSGLGLALVRDTVNGHGGRIDVHSGPSGRGSTFVVVLPVAGEGRERKEGNA